MDDLISRQQAIDAIHCNIVVTGRENAELVAKTIGEFADRIKALPSAQSEPQWIPVSERLPEEPGYYITSNEYNGVGEDFYYDGHFWNADKSAYSVVAWMPKPEAYKPNK